MKTSVLAIASVAAVLMIGCGTTSDSETTDITVERGPLLYATVTDANGEEATMRSGGVYRFAKTPVYPVTSRGGVIDVNRNNVVDEGDVVATNLKLQAAEGDAATIVSTLAVNPETKAMLRDEFNLTEARLYHETPSSDKTVAAVSDEVYKYCMENNISDPATLSLQVMQTLRTQIAARIEAYEADGRDPGEREQALIQNELALEVLTQTQAEIIENQMIDLFTGSASSGSSASEGYQYEQGDEHNASASSYSSAASQSSETNASSSSTASLNDDQKYVLAYMWNEEKMAKDLYLALYAVWGNQVFFNIATRAETQHQASVEAAIASYDLNITNLDTYEEHYSAQELRAFGPGEYSVADVRELYDVLYAKGVQSAQDALEVGCMVEVTDVDDLNEDLVTVAGIDDLVATLENLRSGSYNHYWAFDDALKAAGVEEGCCVLGDDYCKTPDDYPQTNGSL